MGSESKSITPHILNTISGSSIPTRLIPTNIIVVIPIINKLIIHIKFTFFESIFISSICNFMLTTTSRQTGSYISEYHYISTITDLPSDLSPFNHCHFSDNSILPLSKTCGTLWQTPIRICFCSFMCR